MTRQRTVAIERGIPVPRRRTRWPWGRLGVGESIRIPDGHNFASAVRVANLYAERHGKRFTSNGAQRRIWRVA